MNTDLLKFVIILLTFPTLLIALVACNKPDQKEWRARQHLPEPGFIADANKGDPLFHTMCAQCHGAAAKGSHQGPPLVHSIYKSSHHADLAFHWAVRDGVVQHHWKFGNMPPIEGMSPNDVGHIIAYVRSKQREAGIN